MKLVDYLRSGYGPDLSNLANELGIGSILQMDREDAIQRIMEVILTGTWIEDHLLGLTAAQYDLLNKAASRKWIKVREEQYFTAVALDNFLFAGFDECSMRLQVFDEMRTYIQNMDREELDAQRAKSVWLLKCIAYANENVLLFTAEALYSMYVLKRSESIEEMVALLKRIPFDCTLCEMCTLDQLDLKRFNKKHPLYSEYDLLRSDDFWMEYQANEFVKAQRKIPFYIPSVEEIEDLHAWRADDVYVRLFDFLVEEMGYDNEESMDRVTDVHKRAHQGVCFMEVVIEVFEKEYANHEVPDTLVLLIDEAVEKTRQPILRGHTLEEARVLVPAMCDATGVKNAPLPQSYMHELLFKTLGVDEDDGLEEDEWAPVGREAFLEGMRMLLEGEEDETDEEEEWSEDEQITLHEYVRRLCSVYDADEEEDEEEEWPEEEDEQCLLEIDNE